MQRIFSVLVENRSGALSRIAGLFTRRGFNIESLVVGETEDKSVSRMTIVSSGDERIMEQVEKQLNKQIDVIKVKTLDDIKTTKRELLLIKVAYQSSNRSEIMELCVIMKAKIVDISHSTLVIELTDRPEKVDLFIDMIMPFGIVEMARTGMVALQKGADAIEIN